MIEHIRHAYEAEPSLRAFWISRLGFDPGSCETWIVLRDTIRNLDHVSDLLKPSGDIQKDILLYGLLSGAQCHEIADQMAGGKMPSHLGELRWPYTQAFMALMQDPAGKWKS